MRSSPVNPPKNKLPPGVDESGLLDAIAASGYPLQNDVAKVICHDFAVTEEWSYIDRDSDQLRSLDLFGFKRCDNQLNNVKPCVALLIECKRSTHPFVFFQNAITGDIPRFPPVTGLTPQSITVKCGNTSREQWGHRIFGLQDFSYVVDCPANCASFARATLDGKKIEISGDYLYNGVVMPVVKATQHALELYSVDQKPDVFWPTMVLSLVVVDATMILVENDGGASDPVFVPWVRIPRQEVRRGRHSVKYLHYVVDVVHIDYLKTLLDTHLLPLVKGFGERCVLQQGIIQHGARVNDLESWTWQELQPDG